tara:strand:- start:23222 stop:24343 length:1122 start_codon:yes stop_codon:yes gene_type:complete
MAAQNYTAYVGVTPTVVSLDDGSTMAQVRTALGSSMASTDNFLYENTVTQEKTVLWPVSQESVAKLSGCHFPPVPGQGVNTPIIQIVSTAENDQSLMGTRTASGYVYNSQYFGVKISLNETDAAAVTNNQGMFQPVMLQNVVSANPSYPLSFQNAMICQKGAIIQFDISCWGAAGWGYTITSTMNTSTDICGSPLYAIYPAGSGAKMGGLGLRRYNSKAGDTIQMKANAALGIAKQYNVEYSTITVKGWSLSEWAEPRTTNNTPIPSGPTLEEAMRSGINLDEMIDASNFVPPPPAGGGDIPGGTSQPGTPTAGPPSNQKFGTFSGCTPSGIPNTRSEGLVGSIDIFCLVFDSDADAKAVIKILNSGTMGFGS